MKTKLLLLTVALTATFQFSNAQCSRTGAFVQSDPMYSISGDARITFETSGTKQVIFDPNFATVQGADLRVYISKTDDILAPGANAIEVSTSQLINDNGGTGGPGTSPITGMKSFTIPATVNLHDFDFIVIQCIAINERWGHVTLGSNSGPDCSILSVDEVSLSQNVTLFPNPASDQFFVNNTSGKTLDISIYNVLGREVSNIKNSQLKKQPISLSSLNSGVYLIQIKADGNTITKKLVKQ